MKAFRTIFGVLMLGVALTPVVTSVEAAHDKTFDEILGPLREGWQRSGMSEEEITALFEETRDEVRRERRMQKGSP